MLRIESNTPGLPCGIARLLEKRTIPRSEGNSVDAIIDVLRALVGFVIALVSNTIGTLAGWADAIMPVQHGYEWLLFGALAIISALLAFQALLCIPPLNRLFRTYWPSALLASPRKAIADGLESARQPAVFVVGVAIALAMVLAIPQSFTDVNRVACWEREKKLGLTPDSVDYCQVTYPPRQRA